MLVGVNQAAAVLVGVTGYILDWYGLVVLSDDDTQSLPRPTHRQLYAVAFALALGVVAWMRNICVVQGDGNALAMKRWFKPTVAPVYPPPADARDMRLFVAHA